MVDAVGAGLFEDNIRTLIRYVEGGLSPSFTKDEAIIYSLPWNLPFKKLGDFDKKIAILSEDEWFTKQLEENNKQLLKNDCF